MTTKTLRSTLLFKITNLLQIFIKKPNLFKVGLSPSKKNCVTCFIKSSLKIMKNAFYFILNALFVLKIFKFFKWLFGHVGKMVWLETSDEFQNSWHHNLVKKQLKYIYFLISNEVQTTRQWNLVNQRIWQGKWFSPKIMHNMRLGD